VVFNATATLFVHHRMMFELNQAVHEAFSNNNLVIIVIAIIIIVVVGIFAVFRQNVLQYNYAVKKEITIFADFLTVT